MPTRWKGSDFGVRLVLFDLLPGVFTHVAPRPLGLMPIDGKSQGRIQVQPWAPRQALVRFGAIELQANGLMQRAAIGRRVPISVAPQPNRTFDQFLNGARIFLRRPEIPAL